jgi:hypothetical protein
MEDNREIKSYRIKEKTEYSVTYDVTFTDGTSTEYTDITKVAYASRAPRWQLQLTRANLGTPDSQNTSENNDE